MSRPAAFTAREWARLLTVCGALLFEGMSLSSINVQAPLIRDDLALSPFVLQVTVSAFLVVVAGGLLAAGRCADRYGRRRVFMIGVLLFGIGSAAAFLAADATVLVTGRVLQGAGATLSLPAAIAVVTTTFAAGGPRERALGFYSAMGAGGFSLGLVVTGVVTTLFGWRWGFGIYVPLAALVLVVARRAIPADEGVERPAPVDWLGAVTGTVGLTGVTFALAASPEPGQAGPAVVTGLLGAAFLAAFVTRQRTAAQPLVPAEVARAPGTRLGGLALLVAFAGIAASLYHLNLGLQGELGYSALQAGLAFLPQGAAVALLSGTGARAAGRWGAVPVITAGMALEAVGMALFLTVGPDRPYALTFLPASTLVGLGLAAIFPAATALAVTGVPDRSHAVAAGVVTTCQQGGGALGLALVTAVALGTTSVTAVHTWAMTLIVLGTLAGTLAVRLLAARLR
ncbi:MFS transporter [Actinosynnema sp. NPDC050436]|uniref:MFS transporter n=1 Tax=Actinosynnema sp. NPDC050436 TaxID=3155659 RepID=UPI0033E7E48E